MHAENMAQEVCQEASDKAGQQKGGAHAANSAAESSEQESGNPRQVPVAPRTHFTNLPSTMHACVHQTWRTF